MSDKRRGLGRGLGALIPSGPTPTRPGAAPGAVQTRGAIRPPVRPIDVFFDQRPDDENDDAVVAEPDDAADTTFHVEPEGTGGGVDAGIVTDVISETVPDDSRPAAATSNDAAGPAAGDGQDSGGLLPVPGARFAEIPVGAIRPNPRQPRTVFDEDDLAELVHSIQEIGVLQPIVVRPIGDTGPADEAGASSTVEFELVMGERRWRAATEAGLVTVPAIVRETADDDLLRDALLENLHRSQLNPLEEAAAYAQLLEDFGCTHEELAGRIGRSRPQISNTLRLMKLPPLVQRRVAAGVLSAGHARALLALEDGGAMERLAQRIVAEGLSVRAVEELIALGDADMAPRRRNPPRDYPELDRRAAVLADRLDTRVKISMGRSRGRLTVDFAGVEDLDRILRLLEQDASTPAS